MKIKNLFNRKKKEVEAEETRNNPSSKIASENDNDNKEDDIIYETESFRIRKGTKEQMKEIKENSDDDIKVKYKDLELNMCGFNKATDIKTGKLIFGYKIKSEDNGILVHIPKDLTEEEQSKIDDFMNGLKIVSKKLGYEIMYSWDFIEKIYNEKHILDKIDVEGDKINEDKEEI